MTIGQVATDWKFWSVIVSFTALILSQLPPVHILVRKAKLDLEVYSRIFVTHKIGNPNLQMHLIIRNIGGKTLRIKKISATIFRNNHEIIDLPAQTFVANQKDNNQVLLTSFDVKPDEEWSFMTSFLKFFDRTEEKIYRESEMKLKNEILRIKAENGENFFAEVGSDYVKPFNEIFEKKFIWLPGDYTIKINIETNNQKANTVKQYRFTIFESMTDSFTQHKEGYPSGAGIYWESPLYLGQWIEVESKEG